MVRSLIFKRPSPFAYPGGAPKFDQSHPAARNPYLCAVPALGKYNAIDLLTGKAGTTSGNNAGGAGIIGGIGPYLTSAAGDNTPCITFSNIFPSTTVPSPLTMGAIVWWSNNRSINGYFVTTSNNQVGGQGLSVNSTGTVTIGQFGVAGINSGLVITTNTPYFIASSMENGGSTDFVVANLSTGAIRTAHNGGTGTTGVSDNKACVGAAGVNAGTSFDGFVGPAMISNCRLTPTQLRAWALDPWSYWYPNQFDLMNSISAATIAAITSTSTLPMMGV